MKRIFSVVMALMLILSTTSQAMVVTINGQNCTYTMTSPANRKITLNDSKGDVKWWEVKDTSNNIIGVIDGRFVTPTSDVTVTTKLTGNQIVVQQTANGNITYGGNTVNTVQWYEDTSSISYEFTITPNSGYEIETIKVNNQEKEITNKNQMTYTFTNGDISTTDKNQVITATYVEATTTPTPEPEPTTYTISFNANGGNGTMNSQTFTEGTAQNLSANTFTKTGYTFAGWNTKQDGTGDNYTDQASFTATENITLYAKWTPVTYSISYSLDGGTGSNPTSYTIETESFTLSEPTREGYTFTGWTGSNGTTAQTEVTITKGSTGDRNYTANWEKEITQANAPVITTGLTPVNWNGTSWVETTVAEWCYNYNSVAETTSNGTVEGNGNGKWANAQTADGSLYVWIPRYTYKITSGYHQDVDSWNADSGDNKTGKIEIKFSNGTTDDITEGATNASEGYISHPAFTFGSDELQGIWVAKYEASCNDATEFSEGSGTTVSSKPGVQPWLGLSVSDMFDYSYNLNRSLDSHLMKNVEWGAVAYLTNAIGRIPYINNSTPYITGNAGGSQDASSASGVTNAWNTANGVKASTTHNVYGIYDLSGGAYEYVSAYLNNGDSRLLTSYASSLVNSYTNYGTKYVDVYPVGTSDSSANNYAAWSNIKGDAVYETSSSSSSNTTSWDGDFSIAPRIGYAFFLRGGDSYRKSSAGVFSFANDNSYTIHNGFRPVLAIQ